MTEEKTMLHPHYHHGIPEYALNDVLGECHLALVDTCFLDHIPGKIEISRELYDASQNFSLHSMKDIVQELHHVLEWRLQHLAGNEKVHTIPEVCAEVQRFADHFQSVLSWERKIENTLLESVHPLRETKVARRVRRSNDLTLKRSDVEADAEKAGDNRDRSAARHYVNSILWDLRRMQTTLRRYEEAFSPVRRSDHCSETDYRLVEAALGYARSHPMALVALLTNDSDLGRILRRAEEEPKYRNAAVRVRAFKGTTLEYLEAWQF